MHPGSRDHAAARRLLTRDARAIALRRLFASAVDWLLVAMWGAIVFGVAVLASAGIPEKPVDPWRAQGIGLITMTMPVTLYFALCEGSRMRASVGKRTAGLVVTGRTGERLSFARALLRNALKFIPWELGHMLAWQAATSDADRLPGWAWVPGIAAAALPLWWLATMLATGSPPYDRWAGARIRRAAAA